MAGYLVDTQLLVWQALNDRRLSRHHRDILLSDAEIYLSPVSIWEIEIKRLKGHLELPDSFADEVVNAGYKPLPINTEHAKQAGRLPLIHRDPFDRMLIAQAKIEGLTVLTADAHFSSYDIPVL